MEGIAVEKRNLDKTKQEIVVEKEGKVEGDGKQQESESGGVEENVKKDRGQESESKNGKEQNSNEREIQKEGDNDGGNAEKEGHKTVKKGAETEGTTRPGQGKAEESDPFAYTKREEFTSENFKIELRGLPQHYSVAHLKKLLNETLQLGAHKVKPAGYRKNWAYIAFRDQPARTRAMEVLQGYQWKKAKFSVTTAKPVEDPLVKRMGERGNRTNNKGEEDKDGDSQMSITERVTKSVTPLAHLSYDQQLEKKQKDAHHILRKFGSDLAHTNPKLARLVQWQKVRRGGQVCEVDPIVPSPQIDGYRNKCEFSVGNNPETGQATVGFRVASYKAGSMCVAPVSHLKNIPLKMKDVVKEFEVVVRESGLAPFSPLTHEGVWRQLTVRTSLTGALLIIAMIHPQELTETVLGELKQTIVQHFTEGSGASVGVTSIFFKAYAQKERGGQQQPLQHLWGDHHLTETVLGNTFRVSPDAFLQVNTLGAEVLYQHVGDLADLDPSSVLLDVCCGTGTIGVCLSKRCAKVYGVELVPEAVEDARHNAETNGVTNMKVWTGRAEEQLGQMLSHCREQRTVAVVDPPRAGLNSSVVIGLRRCSELERLVYVSCDPASAVKNFINLGRPESKQYQGSFFFPVRAIPVDLFPHTPHFELVILFERWDKEKWTRIMEGNPLPRDEEYFKRIPSLQEGKDGPTKHKNGSDSTTKRALDDENCGEAEAKKTKNE
ncbi:hypothetical protein Pmani_009936 [Petrolisthes manimaculis]|uniref:tRNA (uracil(54)-C(5))-methyltransferase n=1 Tax=Petrolisthes manimaculis TaxID=1843537 RepID=A0AAE1Q354_9EUCA|nr:hypothetical protein Pmani_009936 [Petrolisthes manimaculis]